jgi:hypothetical protein
MNNQFVDFERKNLNILHSLPDREKGALGIKLFFSHPFACRHFPLKGKTQLADTIYISSLPKIFLCALSLKLKQYTYGFKILFAEIKLYFYLCLSNTALEHLVW